MSLAFDALGGTYVAAICASRAKEPEMWEFGSVHKANTSFQRIPMVDEITNCRRDHAADWDSYRHDTRQAAFNLTTPCI